MIAEPLAQDQPLPSQGRRRWRLALVALLLLMVAGAGLTLAQRWAAAPVSVSATRFSTATVERGEFVRDVAGEGRVVAAASPTLVAPQTGVATLRVKAGDEVKRGQVLATLDSPELKARLAQELSSADHLRAEMLRAEVDARQQRATLQAALENAQIDQQTARNDLARQSAAFDVGAVAASQVEQARDRLDKARIALRQAEAGIGLKDDSLKFEVQARRLALERQSLQVADVQRQLDELNVRAPVDGQVGQLFVAERAHVARDARLLTVVDLSQLEVQMQVAENLARDLALGMPGDISGNGQRWAGSVSSISPEVVAGTVAARLRFADTRQAPSLRQNQRLSVRVLLDRRGDVLTVRRGSFVDESGGAYAYVLRGDVAEKRRIRIGATSIDKVEIVDGLAVGDTVVVSGAAAFDGAERIAISR